MSPVRSKFATPSQTKSAVIAWLLEEDQPAVRYRTLTELLHRPASGPDVRAARNNIPVRGWAAEILARRDPAGWWARGKSLYTPKYLSTNWNLLALSDLGATRVMRALDGPVPAEGRRRRRVLDRKGSPLLHRQHGPGADPVRVRGRPPGPQGARLAGPDGAPEGRLDVLVVRGRTVSGTDPRLVGGPERLRGRPPLDVDLGDDGLRRARGRVLSRPGAAPPGKAVRAVVPLPLAGPLLLRPSGRPRR